MTRDQIIAYVISPAIEGGFADNPNDPGGATNYGITQRYLTNARAKNTALPVSVKDLTAAQATALYKADQWEAVKGDAIPPAVALHAFDAAVNEGSGTATMLLQKALGIKVDGVMGPATVAAANASALPALLAEFTALRAAHYAEMTAANASLKGFALGWMRRTVNVYTTSLES